MIVGMYTDMYQIRHVLSMILLIYANEDVKVRKYGGKVLRDNKFKIASDQNLNGYLQWFTSF